MIGQVALSIYIELCDRVKLYARSSPIIRMIGQGKHGHFMEIGTVFRTVFTDRVY